MRFRVCSANAVGIGVAGRADRVGTFFAVARLASFNIPLRKPRVRPTAAANAKCYKPGFSVRLRLYAQLCNRPRCVAGRAKVVCAMARLAIKRLRLCRNAVCELEICVVHFRQAHALSTVDGSESRGFASF
jgi:hypothetical protein